MTNTDPDNSREWLQSLCTFKKKTRRGETRIKEARRGETRIKEARREKQELRKQEERNKN